MDKTKKLFGKNIAKIRVSRNMTQSQLAEKADLALRTVQHMEYGESFAGTATLERLAAALNVSIAELFMDDKMSEAELRLVGLIRQAPQHINTIIDIVERLVRSYQK